MYKGYLVKSKYSDTYSSFNTIQYYNELQLVEKPWYYKYYDYKLSEISYINRSDLNWYDRELYKLHLQTIRLWKKQQSFYWLIDSELNESFSNLWIEILNDPSISIIS